MCHKRFDRDTWVTTRQVQAPNGIGAADAGGRDIGRGATRELLDELSLMSNAYTGGATAGMLRRVSGR